VEEGIRWLLKVQNRSIDDHGWRFRTDIAKSDVLPTCLALLALIQAKNSADPSSILGIEIRSSIENGLETLVEKLRGYGDKCFGFTEQLNLRHTLYAVLVLQTARHCGITKVEYSVVEHEALEWLSSQEVRVLQPIQEHIPIDPDRINPQWITIFST